jgi:hypothetical protein
VARASGYLTHHTIPDEARSSTSGWEQHLSDVDPKASAFVAQSIKRRTQRIVQQHHGNMRIKRIAQQMQLRPRPAELNLTLPGDAIGQRIVGLAMLAM